MLLKYLSFLLTPLSLVIVLLGIALLTKKVKRKYVLLVIAFLSLLFFSNSFIFGRFMSLWSIKTQKFENISSSYDVAIVMGGYIWVPEGTSLIQLGLSGNRLITTIQLYHEKKINTILLAGSYYDINHPESKESVIVKDFLQKNGIPSQDIFIEEKSRNTFENVTFSSKILKSLFPDKNYLVISSNYHLRRTMACFKKTGLKVTPFATGTSFGGSQFKLMDLIPSGNTLFHWEALIHEMMSYMYYYFKGYL